MTFSYEPNRIIAGVYPISTAIKPAGENLPAHAPVSLDGTGKLALLKAGTVSTTGVYGVVPEAANADEDAVVYLTGEFFGDSLTLPDGITVSDIDVPMRNIGIFLK